MDFEKLEQAAREVINKENYIDGFLRIRNELVVTFLGRRRGCPWQGRMWFDDDGNVENVSSAYPTTTPSIIAKEISKKYKEK